MTGYSLDVWVRHAVLRAENVERTKAPLRRGFLLSGRPDLNRGPLVPQTSALTRLRHAPNGHSLAASESTQWSALSGRFRPTFRCGARPLSCRCGARFGRRSCVAGT
jgi:hypothetical protein